MKRVRLLLYFLFALISVALFSLAYPYPFYANKCSHGNVDVYSSNPIDSGWQQNIEQALRISVACPWHDSSYRHRVFLTANTPYKYLFKYLHPSVDGINLPVFNHYFIRGKRVKSHTLGHEMIHTWQEKELGTVCYLFLPEWIREGYAYYLENPGFFPAPCQAIESTTSKVQSKKCKAKLIKEHDPEWLVQFLIEGAGISAEQLHRQEEINYCGIDSCLNISVKEYRFSGREAEPW